MGRILFFVLLGVGLYVAFRIWRAGRPGSPSATREDQKAVGETMVCCAHCGLNVPQSEALAESGHWYCSDAHRQLGRNSG